MGRPKGFKLSDEQKQKMREGRLAKKQVTKNSMPELKEKPELYIKGNETSGFDFWESIRNALRPIHQYTLCKMIEREIVDPAVWKNVGIVKDILSKYFIITEGKKSAKKQRKQNPNRKVYVMTEEHKAKLKAAREAKRVDK